MTELPPVGSWMRDIHTFSATRFVAIDVDGTLKDASQSDLAYHIRSMASTLSSPRYGVRITFATGRAYAGVKELQKAMAPVKLGPLVLYNGAVIYDANRHSLIDARTINYTAAQAILDEALMHSMQPLFYSLPNAVRGERTRRDPLQEEVLGFANPGNEGLPVTEFNGLPIKWATESREAPVDAVAVLLQTSNAARDEVIEVVHSLRARGDLHVTTSGSTYLEVCAAGVNKASALEALARRLQLSPLHFAAVGDNDNDVEMLKWAGCGVAVANASEAAKTASRYVTHRTATGGVIEYLRLLIEARKFAESAR